MRVGFLFNHDQIHQVLHALPVALALADATTAAEIILAVTSDRLRAEVVRHAAAAISRGAITLIQLDLRSSGSRLIAGLGERLVPAKKVLLFRDNLDFFRGLDVLVVAEKTSLVLKTRYGLADLKIIHTRHGAGDRAIGFDAKSALFDHVLVSGTKIRDRLVADAGIDAGRISIVGYPKFDLAAKQSMIIATIDKDRPVVLYNPHVSPHLSSWFKIGREVLDWFVEHDEYQLLFAPHVMLFERPIVATIDPPRLHLPGRIQERYLRAPNIHIDLGSRASTTMAYTDLADIYLGDASSQVYEFLRHPRPCIFLDAHATRWEGNANYRHWTAGRVIHGMPSMAEALEGASIEHIDRYKGVQERLFTDTFDLTDTPSCVRAAEAVALVAGLPIRHHVEAADPLVAHG